MTLVSNIPNGSSRMRASKQQQYAAFICRGMCRLRQHTLLEVYAIFCRNLRATFFIDAQRIFCCLWRVRAAAHAFRNLLDRT